MTTKHPREAHSGDAGTATVDLSKTTTGGRELTGGALASRSTDCRPDVCELEDRGSTWNGVTNRDCPRCGYATIDEGAARTRNPKSFEKK
jgi:hypothetical protein